ncbi:MAG: RNA polymerase sporulation sigma factor SigG [Oscillospiraceae bacterium]|nr:RNA polymerase sporulation sigma factor SigG [Oscillospiraceae bacterium]
MQGKVEICGVNTSRLGLLSAQQMDELLRRSRRGDADAREKLIEGNLRLVLSVIQRFDKRGESPDDLFQVGCVGLLKAIANFDPDKNVRFSTYGVPMIAGEIRRYLRDNSAIRVSRSLRDTAYRVLQCREALTLRLGRDPSLDQIAAELELPRSEISAALDAISAPVSLYDPVFTDGGDPLTVMDQVRDTKNTESSWLEQITLREGFRRLGDREKQILKARFYDGRTQMDVARDMHISQAQVSRLEKGAICELRKYVSVQVS